MPKFLAILACVIGATILVARFSFQQDLEPVAGAELRFAEGADIKSLDPSQTSASVDFRILRCLYETLLVIPPGGGKPVPGCAAPIGPGGRGWKISKDGLTYHLRIRQNARWSNGDPVMAKDFQYALFRVILADKPGPYFSLVTKIKGGQAFFDRRQKQLEALATQKLSAESAKQAYDATWQDFQNSVGIKAKGRHITFTLEARAAYFPELLAFPTFSPLHRASVEKAVHVDPATALALAEPNYFNQPGAITNGPYVLSHRQPGERLVLTPNAHWWNQASTHNQRITMDIISDASLALMRFQNGELDWVPGLSDLDLQQRLFQSGFAQAEVVPAAGTYYYRFNCQPEIGGHPNPFADRRVRRALAMAIDREAIIKHITGKGEREALTFIPPDQIPGYKAPVQDGLTFNPEAARAELEAWQNDTGQRLSQLDLLYNANSANRKIAEVIAHQWQAHLGIQAAHETCEWSVYLDRTYGHDFTVARAAWFGDYVDPTTFLEMFQSDNSNNHSAWHDAHFDDLLTRADHETDPTKRMALLQQAESHLMQEAPMVPIFHYAQLHLVKDGLNLGLNAWNNLRLEQAGLE